jgi:hypothetical protein
VKTNRRNFLSWLGVTSVAGAIGLPETADAQPVPLDGAYDVSWADRVAKAKARAVFDSPDIADGDALAKATMWRDEYMQVYGTPRTDIATVLVLRHMGIALAMDDTFWKRFGVGKEKKVLSPEGKEWAEGNPNLAPAPAGSTYPYETLTQFIAGGGIVLGCDLAFGFAAQRYKKDAKSDSAAARAEALKALVPGVILQPSGIFAVMRAQQAGAGYIKAS